MKNYYEILSIPEEAGDEIIKKAYRQLAFKYHPDKNPGREAEAGEKFKEVNEAYAVLNDPVKRRQYDFARRNPALAGQATNVPGYSGFPYSSPDIFNGVFSNPAFFTDVSRMFEGSGLRFDEAFFKQMFAGQAGIHIYSFSSGPGGIFYQSVAPDRENLPGTDADRDSLTPVRRPGFLSRLGARITGKIGGFLMRRLFGIDIAALRKRTLDREMAIDLTADEALKGGEKIITIERNGRAKKLKVKIPAGSAPDTRIRLKGMGTMSGDLDGDLYLIVRIPR
jgi:curved DNA-binding protein CbpA